MYPTRFPRNHWYVVARPDELGDRPLSRTVLGEAVVLFRGPDGRPAALADRCIHRSMPLSLGSVQDGTLVCGYHGLAYDASGAVVDIPCQAQVPRGRQARSYPVHAGAELIWLWPGDPERADPAAVPDQSWLDGDDWATVDGTLHLDARAQLLNENLTDLSHVAYLHEGSIGTREVAKAPISVEVDGRVVKVFRPMPEVDCPPFFTEVMGIGGRIRRGSVAEFVAPGYHISHVEAEALEPDGIGRCRHRAVHCVTPETETSAHYFWLIARDYRRDSAEVDQLWQDGAPVVLMQDVAAVEAIETVLRRHPDHPPEINISADAGSLRAREIVEWLIAHD
ncbi:MAG TPA: aromatic ring-hydroxylating dioxygenase subunit alpha [Jatrophihabitans sp.]|nr:aromatic ring-hydroxylating dioxygenase subunit alpha [Jatrophihabitans sp.]